MLPGNFAIIFMSICHTNALWGIILSALEKTARRCMYVELCVGVCLAVHFTCFFIWLLIVTIFPYVTCELQMWMNVLVALLGVIATQLVTTLVGVTPALATLDTQAVEFLAHVSTSIYNKCLVFFFVCFLQLNVCCTWWWRLPPKQSKLRMICK